VLYQRCAQDRSVERFVSQADCGEVVD
jgi:hypothetical protein